MKENDNKYLIILNFQSTNNQDIYDSKVRNIENYNIEYRYNNCYLMRLDDWIIFYIITGVDIFINIFFSI